MSAPPQADAKVSGHRQRGRKDRRHIQVGAIPAFPPGVVDSYFKNHFWTFVAAVVVGSGLLTARTVNAVVRQQMEIPPSQVVAQAPSTPQNTQIEAPPVQVESFLERNLFDALREDLEAERLAREEAAEKAREEDAEAEEPEEVDFSQCQESTLGGKLLATVVSSSPEKSVAVFEAPDAPTGTKQFKEGQAYEQATVARVSWRRVYLSNNGRCEMISLDESRASPRRAAPKVVQAKSDDDELGKGIKKVKGDTYEIPGSEIDNVLSNLNTLATQARIVPSFKDGKANGFKLFSIRPNSLYQKIGIRNGDVVQRINGYEMNSPDKALEIYTKLKDATTITVDLQRRGKKKTLTYNIR